MVKNMLTKKLLRDMRRSLMQFVALIFLCLLGTFLFTGISSIASMIGLTNRTYFAENRLADFWINLPKADKNSLLKVSHIPGVESAIARFSVDMEGKLPSEPLINVIGYNGEMDINIPIVREGDLLGRSDKRGCLVQTGFADAYGLQVGERLTVKQNGREYSFIIRGLVYSPEFICVSSSGFPADASKYGYILVNAHALPHLPLHQIIVKTDDALPSAAVEREIRRALPEALVVNREAHQSTVIATDNEKMFHNISLVFPVAAFAVAALIVMTTLTRMVDNQRMQIGTLQSLGYSRKKIRRHFLSYAIWPSLTGSVLGAVTGYFIVPEIIWVLLIGRYEYPYRLMAGISLAAWGLVLFSVGISVLICLYAYRKTEKETTASLLRNKVPKDGKRLFFERITPLWSRLGFNRKMILRNLMRNKMRTFMSCIGLLCCNALIIASMGLQDSITTAADNHYEKAMDYHLLVTLNEKAGEAAAYKHRLEAEGVEGVMELPARVFTDSDQRIIQVTVVENGQTMLKLGKKESYLPIVEGSAAITEKLAKTLGVEVGDSLYLQLANDDDIFLMSVGQIVYNYFSQGVYVTENTWKGLRKGAFLPTHLQLLSPSAACMAEWKGMVEVVKIQTAEDQKADLLNALNMMSSVFSILMVIALALAFVICYNMGLINFAERAREYATLKVLGYHQKEIRGLILSENILISILAIVLSIAPGIGFTGLILAMAETDSTLYIPHIKSASIVISCVITFCFSYFIQRLLARKVRTIDMVDALKSVE